MTLPNFVIIGAMKAGTTSMYSYLRQHPRVFMCPQKEPNFFASDENWKKGREWYESLFVEGSHAAAVGEASTQYTMGPWFPEAPARMAEVIPKAKLIYLVRHPVERMQSQYLHWVAKGRESRPIERALREEAGYVNLSRYALQLERYLEYFTLERILLLRTEDLAKNTLRTVRQALSFLGIEDGWEPPDLKRKFVTAQRERRRPFAYRLKQLPLYRAIGRRTPLPLRRLHYRLTTSNMDVNAGRISDALRTELEDRIREDTDRLRHYLGADFDCWGIA